MSKITKGYLIALVGTTIWSATAVFIRYLTNIHHMPALVLAFWRDLLVGLALTAVFTLAARKLFSVDRKHFRFLIFYGLLLSVFNTIWTLSVTLNGAGISTVLVYSSPGFTLLLGNWLFKEKLNALKIVAVILCLAGCVFVSGVYDPGSWNLNLPGILTGLISGLVFAVYSLAGKSAAQRGINPWSALFYSFSIAAGFLLVYNFILIQIPQSGYTLPDLTLVNLPPEGLTYLMLLAFIPTIGGYGLYTVSLGYLPASIANLIATLEPAMTAAQAYILLGERFTTAQIIGSLVIIAGVVTARLSEPSSK